jgi:ATP-dependent Lhr-like helicase
VLALAACDPACAWGGVLAWPKGGGGQARRSPGATVVLVDAAPVLWVDRGGRSLITFSEEPERLGLAVAALRADLGRLRARALRIQRLDGVEVGAARRAPLLLAAGFERDLGGILLQVPL